MSEHRWFRLLPEWLAPYHMDWLRPDIVAGLTTGAVIIPKAMAYAMMAGLPVQTGLYTALAPMVIYAVLGTSRVLSVSTTTTLAILTAAQLGQAVPNGNPAALLTASATLTLLVGAALLLAYLLRLGIVANFISEPVLVGFRAGIGLVIVADQIPKILGIHFTRGTFVQNVLSIVHTLPKTSLATLAVGLTIIVFLLSMERNTIIVSPTASVANDDRVSAEHGAFPAETASAVAGGSCRDNGRVLLEFATSGCRTGGPHTARSALAGEARPFLHNRAVARRIRDCLDEFHGDGCGRPSLRAKRRADATTRQRAACNRTRQCRRRALRCNARRRRHNADGGQRPRGSSHAISRDGNRGDGTGNNPFPHSTGCDDAASCIGGAGDCVFLRTHQADRVP